MTEKQLFYPLLSVYFSLILGDLQKEKLQIVSIFRLGHKKRGLFQCPLWVGRWKNQVKLPAEFNLFLNMSYSSLAHANLTTRHQNFVADLRLTKSLLKNKLNLSLSANDLFNTSSRYRYTQIHDIMLIQDGSNTQRCIQLSVSYNLNSTRSKFRGTGAGSTERSRMAR